MGTSWDDLRVFQTFAREGTITTAAKVLGVSYPTVSRHVHALERQIGARLFERRPDRFVPTSAGATLLADTAVMEKAALSINRLSARFNDGASGVVRLAVGEVMAGLIARHLAWLHERLREVEVEVEVTADDMSADLVRCEADLLIRDRVPELTGIVTRKLGRIAYALYAARDLPIDRGADKREGPLDGLPWVGLDDKHSDMPAQRWLRDRLGDARQAVCADRWVVVLAAARAGAGLAMLPCCLGDPDPTLKRVGEVAPEVFSDQWLLVHRELRAQPRVRAVMAVVVEFFRRERAAIEGRS